MESSAHGLTDSFQQRRGSSPNPEVQVRNQTKTFPSLVAQPGQREYREHIHMKSERQELHQEKLLMVRHHPVRGLLALFPIFKSNFFLKRHFAQEHIYKFSPCPLGEGSCCGTQRTWFLLREIFIFSCSKIMLQEITLLTMFIYLCPLRQVG